jgi:hypothetical protein
MYEKIDEIRGVSKGLAKWEAFNQAVQTKSALKKGAVCAVLPLKADSRRTNFDHH